MTSLLEIVRRARRRLHTLTRILDNLENPVATDRDLITTILAALPGISAAVAAKDARITQLESLVATKDQQLADAGVAAAQDEAIDTEALAPVKDAVDAILASLQASPSTPDQVPDTIPVEDVPAVLDQATPSTPADQADAAGPDSTEALPQTQSGDTPA